MKITKTKLMQVIREELAEAQGVEFPRLGTGYSDEDVEWGPPVEDDPYYGVEDDPNERGVPGSEPGDEAYLIFAASVLDEELQKAGLAITDAGAGDKLTITLGPDSRFAGTRIIVQVIDAEEPS